MWAVIKFDRKNLNYLKNQLSLKMGKNCKIYCPKMLVEKFKKNKLIKKEFHLMGDYLFCFNENFKENKIVKQLNYTKGVKYFLEGFNISQREITEFINRCKNLENSLGYITEPIFETKIDKFYRFSSGPFTQKIFQILSIQRNKIKILMGNFKTTINKKDYSLSPL